MEKYYSCWLKVDHHLFTTCTLFGSVAFVISVHQVIVVRFGGLFLQCSVFKIIVVAYSNHFLALSLFIMFDSVQEWVFSVACDILIDLIKIYILVLIGVDSLTRTLKLVVTMFSTSFAWRNTILVNWKLITIYSSHVHCSVRWPLRFWFTWYLMCLGFRVIVIIFLQYN